MTFWTSSTDDQKLSQIDGGIECGMTRTQVAMNCGTTMNAVAYFASRHGRTFNGRASAQSAREGGIVQRIVKARRAGASNVLMKDAFSIFSPVEPPRLFSSHPHDEELIG